MRICYLVRVVLPGISRTFFLADTCFDESNRVVLSQMFTDDPMLALKCSSRALAERAWGVAKAKAFMRLDLKTLKHAIWRVEGIIDEAK